MFQNVDEATRKKKAAELLKLVGLGDRMHHKPTELSGGEQQRVAIARALANDPEIILADEPTGNLDTYTAEPVHRLFSELHKSRNYTFVIVTHNENLGRMADRQVRLNKGKIE